MSWIVGSMIAGSSSRAFAMFSRSASMSSSVIRGVYSKSVCSTSDSMSASRVAAMLCSMNGRSLASSAGSTWKRWTNAG